MAVGEGVKECTRCFHTAWSHGNYGPECEPGDRCNTVSECSDGYQVCRCRGFREARPVVVARIRDDLL